MKNTFLKTAGVKTIEEFYQKYPNEKDFFDAHPNMKHYQRGGQQINNPQDIMNNYDDMTFPAMSQLMQGGGECVDCNKPENEKADVIDNKNNVIGNFIRKNLNKHLYDEVNQEGPELMKAHDGWNFSKAAIEKQRMNTLRGMYQGDQYKDWKDEQFIEQARKDNYLVDQPEQYNQDYHGNYADYTMPYSAYDPTRTKTWGNFDKVDWSKVDPNSIKGNSFNMRLPFGIGFGRTKIDFTGGKDPQDVIKDTPPNINMNNHNQIDNINPISKWFNRNKDKNETSFVDNKINNFMGRTDSKKYRQYGGDLDNNVLYAQNGIQVPHLKNPIPQSTFDFMNRNMNTDFTGTAGVFTGQPSSQPDSQPDSQSNSQNNTQPNSAKQSYFNMNPDQALVDMNNVASFFEGDERLNREQFFDNMTNSHNAFNSVKGGDRGTYMPTGMANGQFRPDQKVPVQYAGQAVTEAQQQMYEDGGEYDLTNEQIMEIYRRGGTVKFIS